ncbi:MAG TPA: MFS transporter [bacterium]|jgi:GPH family glycoside/pentoside/hexuronide:cation symporter|nr:MFS transporter [bacterium]
MPLSPAARLLYALGGFGASLLQQSVLLWIFFFYAPPPGQTLPARASPAVVGLAMAVGRLVDAVADPLVAHWSDGLRSRFGRRRPFILAASPLLAICFVLVWYPPAAVPVRANAIFLTIVLGLFFFLYTMVLNPYVSLLPEITAGGAGRVGVTTLQAAANIAGVGAAFVGSSWLSAHLGFPAMGLILAPVALVALLAPVFAVRESIPTEPAATLRASLRAVLADRRFRVFIPAIGTMWFGLSMISLALALIVTVLMGLAQAAVGGVLGISLGATILSLPLTGTAVRRWGTRRTMIAAMILLALLLLPAAMIGRWPVSLSPVLQGTLVLAAAAPAIGALFILPNALLASIAEDHGRAGGGRLEGMFFAFQGLIFNGATSLAAGALGGLLDRLGQAPPEAAGLRVALVVAAASTAAGALIFRRYPAVEV